MTAATQKKAELDRSDMELSTRVASCGPLSQNAFCIKNILNLQNDGDVLNFSRLNGEDFNSATLAPVPPNPPPLMYPRTSFGLPLGVPIHYWMSFGTREETLTWTPKTNLMTHRLLLGFSAYTSLTRRKRLATKKKKRPLFSQHQVQSMENEFTKHRYITENKRAELSSELDLTETQVKTWFQNRRTKWRKELKNKLATTVAQKNQKLQITMLEESSSRV